MKKKIDLLMKKWSFNAFSCFLKNSQIDEQELVIWQ